MIAEPALGCNCCCLSEKKLEQSFKKRFVELRCVGGGGKTSEATP